MATYNPISATEKDGDSPVTVSLLDKLDQNPLALWEGAPGAPKISNAAIATNSIGQDKVSKARTVFVPAMNGGNILTSDCYYARAGAVCMVKIDAKFDKQYDGGAAVSFTLPFDFDDDVEEVAVGRLVVSQTSGSAPYQTYVVDGVTRASNKIELWVSPDEGGYENQISTIWGGNGTDYEVKGVLMVPYD